MVTSPPNAIYRHSDFGPTFGAGDDVNIIHDNIKIDSYTNFGSSYSVPSKVEVEDRQTILAGTYHFTPDEMEVFYLG